MQGEYHAFDLSLAQACDGALVLRFETNPGDRAD